MNKNDLKLVKYYSNSEELQGPETAWIPPPNMSWGQTFNPAKIFTKYVKEEI